MIRYFLVDLGANQGQRQSRINALRNILTDGGPRVLPHQVLNYRTSLDGRYLLGDAEVTEVEHASLVALGYVTDLGTAEEARAYLLANLSLWERPLGG